MRGGYLWWWGLGPGECIKYVKVLTNIEAKGVCVWAGGMIAYSCHVIRIPTHALLHAAKNSRHAGSFRGLSITKCGESPHVALHCSTTTKVFPQEHSQTGSHKNRPLRENVMQLCLALFEEENGECAKIPRCSTFQYHCDKSAIIIFSIWWYNHFFLQKDTAQ